MSNESTLYRPNGNYHYFRDKPEVHKIISTGTVIYPDLVTQNPLGASFTQYHRIENTILVKRDYPSDKEQLALLLRQCRFFAWDCLSATNFNTMMCGAIPVLLHDMQIHRRDINQMETRSKNSIYQVQPNRGKTFESSSNVSFLYTAEKSSISFP